MDGMYPDPFRVEPDVSKLDVLIQELELQAALLTTVATGGPRIEDVKREYQDRGRRLVWALERRGLEYPFPWQDLDALERQRSGLTVSDPGGGPLTWTDLDARLAGLSAELVGAASR